MGCSRASVATASSRAASSPAQPWTSPMAKTVSPSSANGAGCQAVISTGTDIEAMLGRNGVRWNRTRFNHYALVGSAGLFTLRRAALELLLDRAIDGEMNLHGVAARHPQPHHQHVVGIGHGIDADLSHLGHPLVVTDDLLHAGDRRLDVVVERAGEFQLDAFGVVA